MLSPEAKQALERAKTACEDAYDVVQGVDSTDEDKQLKWLAMMKLSRAIALIEGLCK